MNKRLIIFTGAGFSSESGILTFRTGSNVFWNNHRVKDVFHIDTFRDNYDLVHYFYNSRRVSLKKVKPNLAHMAIAE